MLWIVGTSVSIEDGGYAPRLRARMRTGSDIESINLSVGDQTSLMGCMRVLQQLDRVRTGDVVVWEYSLLDTLLTEACFSASDTHAARRLAWRLLIERGASLLVLMTPPRRELRRRTACERQIVDDAAAFGIPCMDMREVLFALDVTDAAVHYRDDRHPRVDSPLIDAVVDRVHDFILAHHGAAPERISALPEAGEEQHWRWLDARALAAASGLPVQLFENSLMSVPAAVLPVDGTLPIPSASRIVGLGVLSTHASGGAWCGHPGCAPASTRLPDDLGYDFLLRSTALPCVRGTIDSVASAPAWAYARGVWAAYGQALCDVPGEVAVFGVLYVPVGAPDAAVERFVTPSRRFAVRVWRWLRRHTRAA